jgi:hypothetical protein
MEITKRCHECGFEKPLSAFHKCFSGKLTGNKAGYDQRNPRGTVKNRCKQCYALRFWTKARLDFYEAMGEKCECCGEQDIRFLTLDHRNNDGNEHRKSGIQCQQIYLRARKEGYPKDKYALLCYNCNCAKAHRSKDGTCPHKSPESLQDVLLRMREQLRIVGQKYRAKETGPRPWKSIEMRGQKYAATKLTEEKAAAIRSLKSSGRLQKEVAAEFGIGRQMVGLIWSGQRWPANE